jgi:hypothetical protein
MSIQETIGQLLQMSCDDTTRLRCIGEAIDAKQRQFQLKKNSPLVQELFLVARTLLEKLGSTNKPGAQEVQSLKQFQTVFSEIKGNGTLNDERISRVVEELCKHGTLTQRMKDFTHLLSTIMTISRESDKSTSYVQESLSPEVAQSIKKAVSDMSREYEQLQELNELDQFVRNAFQGIKMPLPEASARPSIRRIRIVNRWTQNENLNLLANVASEIMDKTTERNIKKVI